MLIDGEKWACEACVRGHRVTTCKHHDRPLIRINRKGRPFSTCSKSSARPRPTPTTGFLPIAPRPGPAHTERVSVSPTNTIPTHQAVPRSSHVSLPGSLPVDPSMIPTTTSPASHRNHMQQMHVLSPIRGGSGSGGVAPPSHFPPSGNFTGPALVSADIPISQSQSLSMSMMDGQAMLFDGYSDGGFSFEGLDVNALPEEMLQNHWGDQFWLDDSV